MSLQIQILCFLLSGVVLLSSCAPLSSTTDEAPSLPESPIEIPQSLNEKPAFSDSISKSTQTKLSSLFASLSKFWVAFSDAGLSSEAASGIILSTGCQVQHEPTWQPLHSYSYTSGIFGEKCNLEYIKKVYAQYLYKTSPMNPDVEVKSEILTLKDPTLIHQYHLKSQSFERRFELTSHFKSETTSRNFSHSSGTFEIFLEDGTEFRGAFTEEEIWDYTIDKARGGFSQNVIQRVFRVNFRFQNQDIELLNGITTDGALLGPQLNGNSIEDARDILRALAFEKIVTTPAR